MRRAELGFVCERIAFNIGSTVVLAMSAGDDTDGGDDVG